jgi:uncharacterized membrane protein
MATEPDITPYVPSQEAKDLHAKHLAQAWTDQQASTDAFDNNLLTFSSAALGLSIAFIKDIVPLEGAEWLKTLYFSWGAFAACILVTISSFQIAAQAQVAHQKTLADYYLRGDNNAMNRKSRWFKALPYCAGVGSLLLLLGIVSTLVFASKNVSHYKESKAWQMTTKQKK